LAELAVKLMEARSPSDEIESWCIFDNTGSGSAAANALDLAARVATAETD
jgi:hypothetical protein